MVEPGSITKADLKQYPDLRREVRRLEERIKNMAVDKNEDVVHDVVTGSSPSIPYQKHAILITGVDFEAHESRVRRYRKLLKERKSKCDEQTLRIEEFINTIPDSRIRQIFDYRYIGGCTWTAVATRMGYPDESYPRRLHNNYLENI